MVGGTEGRPGFLSQKALLEADIKHQLLKATFVHSNYRGVPRAAWEPPMRNDSHGGQLFSAKGVTNHPISTEPFICWSHPCMWALLQWGACLWTQGSKDPTAPTQGTIRLSHLWFHKENDSYMHSVFLLSPSSEPRSMYTASFHGSPIYSYSPRGEEETESPSHT